MKLLDQKESYACSPYALGNALRFLGVKINGSTVTRRIVKNIIMKFCKTDKEGTAPSDLLDGAKALVRKYGGVKVTERRIVRLKELKKVLNEGVLLVSVFPQRRTGHTFLALGTSGKYKTDLVIHNPGDYVGQFCHTTDGELYLMSTKVFKERVMKEECYFIEVKKD